MTVIEALLKSGQALDKQDALDILEQFRHRLHQGEDPEELLYEYNLDEDHIFEILGL